MASKRSQTRAHPFDPNNKTGAPHRSPLGRNDVTRSAAQGTCAECRHAAKAIDISRREVLQCRIKPAQVLPNGQGTWPIVRPMDWCSEQDPAVEAEPAPAPRRHKVAKPVEAPEDDS